MFVCLDLLAELGEDSVFRILDLCNELSARSEAKVRERSGGGAIFFRRSNSIHIFRRLVVVCLVKYEVKKMYSMPVAVPLHRALRRFHLPFHATLRRRFEFVPGLASLRNRLESSVPSQAYRVRQ